MNRQPPDTRPGCKWDVLVNARADNLRRIGSLAGAAMLAVAFGLALSDALTDGSKSAVAWVSVVTAGVGVPLMVWEGLRIGRSRWALVAGVAPIMLLALVTAPLAVEFGGSTLGVVGGSVQSASAFLGALSDLPWLAEPGSALLATGSEAITFVRAALDHVVELLGLLPQLVTRPMLRVEVVAGAIAAYLFVAAPLGRMPQYGVCCTSLGVAAVFFLAWEPPPPKPVPIAHPLVNLQDDLLSELPAWKGRHQPLPDSVEGALGADAYLNLMLTSPGSPYDVLVFATYNANAMTNIPHVPWVCMTQSGYRLITLRQDEIPHPTEPGKEIRQNVILFEAGEGMPPSSALMFQYFNVGGVYVASRQRARILATSGAVGRKGSYLAQTQVAIYMSPEEGGKAMDRQSQPYRLGRQVLDRVVALLEARYYPDLHGSEGGT